LKALDAIPRANRIVAEYEFPYLAHAPMEPLDAVLVRGEDGGVDAYMGSQIQTGDQAVIGSVLGLAPNKVRIHTQLAGGSFGRRAQAGSPYAAEAAEVFKAFGGTRPVKHVWTREDDIKGGFYRPIFVHRLKGGLDREGRIAGSIIGALPSTQTLVDLVEDASGTSDG
jgi:isoquinoline 1-oxidoreductase beta subunit